MSESPGRDRISLPSLFRARTGAIVVVTLLSLVGATLNLAQPLVVSELISRLGGEGAGRWVAALIGLLLGAVLIGAVQHYLLTRTAEQAVFDLRARIVTRMIRLPQKVYDTSHSGDMVTRLSTDTTVVRGVFTGGLTEAVGSVFLVVGAIIAMSLIDPVMLFVVLGVTGAGVVTMLLTSRKIQAATTRTQDAVGRLSASMSRVLSAIRTVKASRAEDALEGQIVHDAAEARDLGIRIGRIEALLYPISGAVLQIAFLLVIGVGGSRVATGQMELGDLVAFILFLFMLISPVSTMFQSVMSIRSAQGAMDRINRLLDVPLEQQGGEPALGAGVGGVVDPARTVLPREERALDVGEGDRVRELRGGGAGLGDGTQRAADRLLGAGDDGGHPGGDPAPGQRRGDLQDPLGSDLRTVHIDPGEAVDLQVNESRGEVREVFPGFGGSAVDAGDRRVHRDLEELAGGRVKPAHEDAHRDFTRPLN